MVRPHISVGYMMRPWYGTFLKCGLSPEINQLCLAGFIDNSDHVCNCRELSLIQCPDALARCTFLRHKLRGTFGEMRAKLLIQNSDLLDTHGCHQESRTTSQQAIQVIVQDDTGALVYPTSLSSCFELIDGWSEVLRLFKELVHVEVEGIFDALVLVDLSSFGLAVHTVTRAVNRHKSELLQVRSILLQ